MEWIDSLNFTDLHDIVSSSKISPTNRLLKASLNLEEMKLLENMRLRINTLAQLASDLGVRLMIDAEHTYFQPAIDKITTDLEKKFNKDYPVVFSTYQMYLKDSSKRLEIDVERSKKINYCFAAKLVREAYMAIERTRAKEMNYEDPINGSRNTTHENYDNAVKNFITQMAAGERLEVMIASHNRHSVERALLTMKDNNMTQQSNVYFG
jgi:proline dehydrogenase